MRGFDRIEIFALDILDQGQFQHPRIGDVLDHDGYFRQASQLRSAPTAFTGNQLKSALMSTNNQGLDDPVRSYRSGEFLQAVRLEDYPRLDWIRVDGFDGKVCRGRLCKCRSGRSRFRRRDLAWSLRQQCRQSLTEYFALLVYAACSFSRISLASLI